MANYGFLAEGETVETVGDVKPWEPVRQIVRAPDQRMWLLDAVEGVVERQILLDEIQGWAAYDAKPPVTVGGVLTFMPPDEYVGPHWEMRNRTWAQMQALAVCTCEGVKPEGEHYAGCCLVTVSAGLWPGKQWPDCTCGGLTDASGEVIGHTAGCAQGDAVLAAAVDAGLDVEP